MTVFLSGPCNENAATDQECETVLYDLENINDDLEFWMILRFKLVTTEDIKYARTIF